MRQTRVKRSDWRLSSALWHSVIDAVVSSTELKHGIGWRWFTVLLLPPREQAVVGVVVMSQPILMGTWWVMIGAAGCYWMLLNVEGRKSPGRQWQRIVMLVIADHPRRSGCPFDVSFVSLIDVQQRWWGAWNFSNSSSSTSVEDVIDGERFTGTSHSHCFSAADQRFFPIFIVLFCFVGWLVGWFVNISKKIKEKKKKKIKEYNKKKKRKLLRILKNSKEFSAGISIKIATWDIVICIAKTKALLVRFEQWIWGRAPRKQWIKDENYPLNATFSERVEMQSD